MKPVTPRLLQTLASVMLVTLALLFPTTLRAQEARGAITGRLTDSSQAAVPGAAVKITNTAMGTSVTAQTSEAGLYHAPYLIPGTYQIEVQVSGFKKYVRDAVLLQVGETIEINIELVTGALNDTVVVTADAPTLDTTSASLGQVVDARRIQELPIGHGDPYALIGLAGGVTFTRSLRLDRPFEPTHIVGYSMDGTRANRSDLTIDGASSTATANAGEVISSFVPPQDLVQEFKVQTATFDAQFGNTEGGVTNLSIKSGTNQFHGTGYYTNFTPGTSANDFFANRARQPLADFYYHRFGGTVGGPVWIPKVYKGENRTFFMYGVEGIREARPRNNGTLNIPTGKMRTGDFSELLAIGANYQIYNPFTARTEGSRIRRDPFQGNIIPANLINPVAKKFVDTYLPKPTSAATAADGTGNFQQPGLKERAIYYSHTIRIDHILNDKHRIFGRASWYDRDSDYNNYYGNLATGSLFQFISRQGVVDHVWTLSPTMVLNTRYGYNRFIRVDNTNPENHGFDLTSLGFPSSYANLIGEDIRRFPRFDISGYQGTGFGADFRPNDTHSFNAILNKAFGAHSLKFGTEFRSYRENSLPTGNNQTGQFNFDNTYTRGPLDNSPAPTQLGFSFAAFLLGIPTSGFINQPANYAEQSTTWGFFAHDDWRVSSRLTLNVGLRYELEGALTERFNRSVRGFDDGFAQPFEAAARTAFAAAQSRTTTATPEVAQFNVRGGLTFAGVGGEPRELYEVPKKNFMPRFGLAYKLNDKTVARAGYGIFFGFLGQRRGDIVQSGFSTTTPLNVTLNNGLTFEETLANPFRNGLLPIPGASQGAQTFLGQSITFFNARPLSPYMQRWQLSVQRELPAGFTAEVGYVGNRGTHIEITRNINATPLQYLATGPFRDQARIDYLSANVPNPFVGLMPASAGTAFRSTNIARERLLRPFPQFDSVNTTNNDGYSWYHSLQLNLEKRFSKGYTVNAAYTYSKFMEAVEYLNAADPRPTQVISGEDRPHRFVVSGIYELPFGKGRQFLAGVNRVAAHFVSGWQVSGIYAFQSGPMLNFGNVIYFGDPKAIRLPGDQQTLARWINTTGFVALRSGNTVIRDSGGNPVWVDFNDPCKTTYNATSCPGTPLATLRGFNRDAQLVPGSNVRAFPQRFGFLRADKVSNFDFGIIKKTFIGEKKELQFRAELLNALNHPLLFTGGINLNPAQAGFGQITSGTQENYPRRVQMTLKFVF
jgi:hypothetical protein